MYNFSFSDIHTNVLLLFIDVTAYRHKIKFYTHVSSIVQIINIIIALVLEYVDVNKPEVRSLLAYREKSNLQNPEALITRYNV